MKTQKYGNEREDQPHHFSNVKLVTVLRTHDYVITCIKKILSQFIAEMRQDDFNAFKFMLK